MRRICWIVLFAFSLSVTGCPSFIGALPAAIAAVTDGIQIVDAITDFVKRYFVAHPDPEKQQKVEESIAKCRATLNAALRIARGTKDLDGAKSDAAFEEFRAAYQELIGLVGPLGVRSQKAGNLSAMPGGLAVPEPLALQKGSFK